MKPIFLIGYMGSGKTTLGRSVAEKLNMEFVDIDIYIENRYHKTVKELFDEKGEDAFRKIEQAILHETADFENVIIACGGGTPCFFDNMDFMNKKGVTFYREVSEDRILTRLTIPSAKAKRPLVANKTNDEIKKFINEALGKRRSTYEQAHFTFNAEELETIQEIEKSANAFVKVLTDKAL